MEEKFTFFWNGHFSNWHKCTFKVEETTYNCTEQFMMAEKARLFNDQETLIKIMSIDSPKEQKALGRKVKNFDVNKWNTIAKDIVYIGCYAKFSQNEYLKKLLLETEGTLVEASPYDKIWGIGLASDQPEAKNRNTWNGTNWLGEILTKVRNDLQINVINKVELKVERDQALMVLISKNIPDTNFGRFFREIIFSNINKGNIDLVEIAEVMKKHFPELTDILNKHIQWIKDF